MLQQYTFFSPLFICPIVLMGITSPYSINLTVGFYGGACFKSELLLKNLKNSEVMAFIFICMFTIYDTVCYFV